MIEKPTRCIDPCVKYPEWVECYEDTFYCVFESGCIYNLEDTVPTEEEEKEFEKRLNELERGGIDE